LWVTCSTSGSGLSSSTSLASASFARSRRYPAEAFSHYRYQGVANVICEEKHMGSRAVVIVCRDQDTARRRFGVVEDAAGICYTRTGRRFFDDCAMELAFIAAI
jgi:protein phosphatase